MASRNPDPVLPSSARGFVSHKLPAPPGLRRLLEFSVLKVAEGATRISMAVASFKIGYIVAVW